MHTIHTTPGFIIDSRPYGEAGKIFSIFTRDFGLIRATAQGIRLEKSKLRYHAVEYSFGIFSLVRGREYWRLTSAQEARSRKPEARSQKPEVRGTKQRAGNREQKEQTGQEVIARIALLLRRLLHGEEAHAEVFDAVESCQSVIASEDLSEDQMKTLESVTVFRLLDALGYIGNDRELTSDVRSETLSRGLLDRLPGKRTLMNTHINKALRESQL